MLAVIFKKDGIKHEVFGVRGLSVSDGALWFFMNRRCGKEIAKHTVTGQPAIVWYVKGAIVTDVRLSKVRFNCTTHQTLNILR